MRLLVGWLQAEFQCKFEDGARPLGLDDDRHRGLGVVAVLSTTTGRRVLGAGAIRAAAKSLQLPMVDRRYIAAHRPQSRRWGPPPPRFDL